MEKIREIVLSFVVIASLCTSKARAQWTLAGSPNSGAINALVWNGNTLFAATSAGGVFMSTNGGDNWSAASTGLPDLSVSSLEVIDSTLFIGTTRNGVFRSTDNGTSWKEEDSGFTDKEVNDLVVLEGDIYCLTRRALFATSDKGVSWRAVHAPDIDYYLLAVGKRPDDLRLSLFLYGHQVSQMMELPVAFFSIDTGRTWNPLGPPTQEIVVSAFKIIRNRVFVGTIDKGVCVSGIDGIGWTNVSDGITNDYVTSFTGRDTVLLVGTLGGVFLSTDDATSWVPWNDGFTQNVWVQTFLMSSPDGFIYAGTKDGHVWKRQLSQTISRVHNVQREGPNAFVLDQNYPNPFNPSTAISFHVAARSFVSLMIYDLLGRRVSNLVSAELVPGDYVRYWNPSGMPSGPYFYRLEAGPLTQTKRLLLLK